MYGLPGKRVFGTKTKTDDKSHSLQLEKKKNEKRIKKVLFKLIMDEALALVNKGCYESLPKSARAVQRMIVRHVSDSIMLQTLLNDNELQQNSAIQTLNEDNQSVSGRDETADTTTQRS